VRELRHGLLRRRSEVRELHRRLAGAIRPKERRQPGSLVRADVGLEHRDEKSKRCRPRHRSAEYPTAAAAGPC